MLINIDSNKYKDMTLASLHMGLIADRFKKRQSIKDLTIKEIIESVGNNGQAFCRALLDGGTDEENFVGQTLLVLEFDGDLKYREFKEKCEKYSLSYAFTYKTLGSCANQKGFGAVFLMDRWIKNPALAKAANILLRAFFSPVGAECLNLGGYFLGGKGIIEKKPYAKINIVELARNLEIYYRETKGRNNSKELKRLGKKSGICVKNGELCIYNENEFDLEGIEDKINDNGIIMLPYSEGKACEGDSAKEQKIRKDIPTLTGYNQESLCKLCPLLNDFVNGEDIHYDQEFLLVTSLVHIKGGKKLFFDNLQKRTGKWNHTLNQNRKHNILNGSPMYCENSKTTCPYYNNCKGKSLYDKASRKIRKLENTEVFYEIDKCVSVLKKMLEEAVAARNADIHIIKAQTALGKTEQYAEIVKNWIGKKFIIAVPTIKLQREVAERIEAKGVECEITESMYTKIAQLGLPDLEEKLNKDFSKGFTKRGKKTILEYKKEHMDELSPRQLEIFNEILKKRKIGYSGARCIVTTHALFLMKELYKMQDYEIIIDEDLLMTLFHFTSSLPLSDIEKLLELPFIDADNREQLERILELDNEETLQVNFTSLSESVLEKLYEQRNEFTGPVPKLFDSTHVIMCKNKKEIVFIKKYDFGDCSKMTILSATADRALYEDYFSGKTINFREVYKAEYKGKVLQYTAHTLSRAFFNKNGGTDVLEEIKEKYIGDIPVITFKMLAPDSEIHFGKTEGFNVYRGMDIAVIGTPHNSPVLYKMVGAMLGYDTSGSLHRYRVERGGYSFPMMSYADKKMRNMQLFFIESELEQAVGRARLLRENCTVYVFSNYPCQQAEIIENPYLRVKTEEDTEKNEDEIIQNETMEY